MVLKAVPFDLGLTLIQTASFPEIYRRILAQFGTQVSIDHILLAQSATAKEYDISTYDESRRKEFWVDYNVSVLKKLNIEQDIVFLATQIDELWWTNSECTGFS